MKTGFINGNAKTSGKGIKNSQTGNEKQRREATKAYAVAAKTFGNALFTTLGKK